jgi:endonuclease YncB( thermonuclease family)
MSAKPVLLAWLLVATSALAQDVIHGRVVGVTDGDTIKVLAAEKQLLRVRVAWIDAAESSQAFGQRAKQAMSALVSVKMSSCAFTPSIDTAGWSAWCSRMVPMLA